MEFGNLQMYIDGDMKSSVDNLKKDIYSPLNGQKIASLAWGNQKDSLLALESASKGFKVWSKLPLTKRKEWMSKLREQILENEVLLRKAISYEMGKPYAATAEDIESITNSLEYYADVIDIGATTVVILAGTNDIAGNTGPMSIDMILNNLKSMTGIALANNVKVILCSVLPAYDYPWSPNKNPNIKIPKLNSKIKKYAKKSGVHYLDYFKALDNGNNGIDKEFSYDGVHLTLEGYKVLEPLLENALKKVTK